jgi:hypothetical protein
MPFGYAELPRLLEHRLDWAAEHVAGGCLGQQGMERVFLGLKEGGWQWFFS